MIDFWPNPAWHFVRSKVMLFLPGLPLACSAGALPQPDDVSGLEVFTKKPVKFGDNGEYICKNRSLVIQNHEMRLSIEKVHSMYFFCFSRYIIFLSVNWIEPKLSDNYILKWFFSQVTNDGITFKLPCDTTGQFLRRDWQVCRLPKVCTNLPPIPDFKTGLWLSDSINVPEFSSAVYQCKDNLVLKKFL